ncbi:MAG TPA: YidC/Oxa1 family membrane protein insertase [Actinomycetota bacterium]|nr:YidC/Oxa1 family membrane protein insertase [Actinomycetota bacterium]
MTAVAGLAVTWWQGLLDGLGSVLAFIYSLVPNYGLAIILFTLGIRLLLLPLGIKQVRSMQSMQAIQPQMKALQQKYKGNRQKLNEEVMKLYRENRVNPFMGCLPLLAQVPVLIALFAVLQFPLGLTHIPHSESARAISAPPDSRLYVDLVCSGPNASELCRDKTTEKKTNFLGANLLCNALQAGDPDVRVQAQRVADAPKGLDCGSGLPSRIPYYIFAIGMIASTYYQQRQMQRVSPASAQQPLLKYMPLLFGFWGFIFPAGLVIYWTTTNLVQIGQQRLMLGPAPAKTSQDGSRRPLERATGVLRALSGRTSSSGETEATKTESKRRESPQRGGDDARSQVNRGAQKPNQGKRAGSGGRNGRSRKKRRKR